MVASVRQCLNRRHGRRGVGGEVGEDGDETDRPAAVRPTAAPSGAPYGGNSKLGEANTIVQPVPLSATLSGAALGRQFESIEDLALSLQPNNGAAVLGHGPTALGLGPPVGEPEEELLHRVAAEPLPLAVDDASPRLLLPEGSNASRASTPITDLEAGRFSSDQVSEHWLLPPVAEQHRGKKCLVLDLDETLLHSSFKIIHQADYIVPVEIESQYHNVYVIKRPGVAHFLASMKDLYEVIVFTASLAKYADPVLDILDTEQSVTHRLFREACYNYQGNYVKDLSRLGRNLENCIIIDNSPASYVFHPAHAIPISSWFNDMHDTELIDLIPFLEDMASKEITDVSLILNVGTE